MDRAPLMEEQFCLLTTTGRRTGRPHTIEIWFGIIGETLYMLSGEPERSDWVLNLRARPEVEVKIGSQTFRGRARPLGPGEEDSAARKLVVQRYNGSYAEDLTTWGRESLVIAVDLGSGD